MLFGRIPRNPESNPKCRPPSRQIKLFADRPTRLMNPLSMFAFEVLDFSLVLSGGFAAAECSKVTSLARFWIGFHRIQPILTRLQFSNHDWPFESHS